MTRKGRYEATQTRGHTCPPYFRSYRSTPRRGDQGAEKQRRLRRKTSTSGRRKPAGTLEGVKDAARLLLAEQASPGNEVTWERLRAKFPDHEDAAAVEQAIAEEAIMENRRTEDEHGGT